MGTTRTVRASASFTSGSPASTTSTGVSDIDSAYEKGTSSKLNNERVERLKGIDFQFRGPKSRGRPSTGTVSIVPSLPWEKRLQQMENFKR